MRHLASIVVAALCLAGAMAASSDALRRDLAGIPAPVAKQMRAHKIAPRDVSFYVRDPTQAQPILSFNAEFPRNPASSIKLLTTAAALEILRPSYRWKTRAYAAGSVTDGRLDGDLIIKGYGDPDVAAEDLWRLLWGVRERGIAQIAGNLILDGSWFAPPTSARGDFDGNATSAYNALPYALSVNLQTTRVHLVRDAAGGGVRVFTDPPLSNLEVENSLRLVSAPCKRKYHKPGLRVVEELGNATLRLTGTFADGCGESDYARLLLDPAEHSAGALVALWQAMGGTIGGRVREGVLQKDARLLHTLESERLEDAVQTINKSSNNLMSRTLFLTLGAEREGPPGSLEKGRRTLGAWLQDRRIEMPELIIDNGSGLSRDTRISAASMGRLLEYAYGAPTMPQFLSSLSIAGVDGTMRKRFKRGPIKGRALIKTGTLRGVTAAAGYVLDRNDRRWILVSLINNPRLQAWRGKGIENTLIQWVYERAGEHKESASVVSEP
jgi:D-alanyl-D-alanine carboxypeptidase/D-alanyl-D-alanine-endopeptidase (penicillin-binding protein 4)